jgi:hypothetical protein
LELAKRDHRGPAIYPGGRNAAQRDQGESEWTGLAKCSLPVYQSSCLCSVESQSRGIGERLIADYAEGAERRKAWRGHESSKPLPPYLALCISSFVSFVIF